jgi:transcriptional regulator with XRE-family HTH domain
VREVGQRIQAIRKSKGLSMRQAAQQAGVCASTWTNIERGRHALSVRNLRNVAAVLTVPVSALLPNAFEHVAQHVPPGRRLHVHAEGLEAELLTAPGDPMGLSVFLLTFMQAAEWSPPALHQGQEYLYVIEGVVEGSADERTERLEAGSCASFAAERPHRLRALGPARALLVACAAGWPPGRR